MIICRSVFNLCQGRLGISFTLGVVEAHYRDLTSSLILLGVLCIKEDSTLACGNSYIPRICVTLGMVQLRTHQSFVWLYIQSLFCASAASYSATDSWGTKLLGALSTTVMLALHVASSKLPQPSYTLKFLLPLNEEF